MAQSSEVKKSKDSIKEPQDLSPSVGPAAAVEAEAKQPPEKDSAPKRKKHEPSSTRKNTSRIALSLLVFILAGNIYYNYKTSEELALLKAGRSDAGDGHDLLIKKIEGSLREEFASLSPKVAELSDRLDKMVNGQSTVADHPKELSQEQLNQVNAYLTSIKKEEGSPSDPSTEIKTIKALILLQVLQQFIQNNQPYESVLADLKKLFEENKWITQEFNVSFDILGICAQEGTPSLSSLHKLPHRDNAVALPSVLSWISHFIRIESSTSGNMSPVQKQALINFLDHRQYEEALSLVKRHLDQEANLSAEDKDAWQKWMKSVELHQKIRHSFAHIQQALITKGLSHVGRA